MRPHVLLFALAAFARFATAQAPPPGWDSYQVLMWSTGSPINMQQWISRLQEIGMTGEECTGCNPAPYLQANFRYYVENLVPELGFLNSRSSIYSADFNGYFNCDSAGKNCNMSARAAHDKTYLIRQPSFSDPRYWSTAQPRLETLVGGYVGRHPLLYQLRDELSVGSYASPFDYCFDPHTLADFRGWLQTTYDSLDALNQEWATSFATWDDVVPFTTYEIKDRERAALAAGTPENYAPWADHRAFMDVAFAGAIDRLRGYIRGLDDTTPVGIEGLQMPGAWGGYDLWRLSQAADWIEPYDIAGSREIFRSFMPPGSVILTTVFGSDFNSIRRRLWWLLLHGDRGAIVWDDDTDRAILKTAQGQPVTDRGRGLAQIFNEMKAVAPQIFSLSRLDDRIAIHYSQASLRAHWLFDSREDKDSWPRRFSSYEAVWSRIARVRDSFMRVIEDLGLQYSFVSYDQIENDGLASGGYRVLILPESTAMSDLECRKIEAFVNAGGTVIADNMIATMDEHGRRRASGRLDALFGIHRQELGWLSAPAGGTFNTDMFGFEPDISVVSGDSQQTDTGVPVVIRNQVGDGHTVYLNLDMHDYGKYRLTPPRGNGFRSLLAHILKDAGVEPAVQVLDTATGSPAACVEVWRFQGNDGKYISVMRNPEFNASSLKAAGYPANSAIEVPIHIQILVNGSAFTEADLDPWSPLILKIGDTESRRELIRAP
jgi:hypothetical protein